MWGIQIWLLELSTTNALPRLLQKSKMASRIFKLQKKIWLFSILWVKKTFWKHCLWAKIVLLSFSNDNWHQPFLLETPMGQVKLQRNTDICSTLWSKKFSGNTPHEPQCFYWASPPKTDTTCSSWRPLWGRSNYVFTEQHLRLYGFENAEIWSECCWVVW